MWKYSRSLADVEGRTALILERMGMEPPWKILKEIYVPGL